MAEIENLISSSELKWDYLFERVKKKIGFVARYDDLADLFILLSVSPQQETVVYYVDGHVGLLVDPDTMNVVGFQVEAFKRSFLAEHASVERVWRLHESSLDVKPSEDLALNFKPPTKDVVREVIRATEDVIGEPAIELVAELV